MASIALSKLIIAIIIFINSAIDTIQKPIPTESEVSSHSTEEPHSDSSTHENEPSYPSLTPSSVPSKSSNSKNSADKPLKAPLPYTDDSNGIKDVPKGIVNMKFLSDNDTNIWHTKKIYSKKVVKLIYGRDKATPPIEELDDFGFPKSANIYLAMIDDPIVLMVPECGPTTTCAYEEKDECDDNDYS